MQLCEGSECGDCAMHVRKASVHVCNASAQVSNEGRVCQHATPRGGVGRVRAMGPPHSMWQGVWHGQVGVRVGVVL